MGVRMRYPVEWPVKESVAPTPDEKICVISYIIATTRVGGGPDERKGFWAAYREAYATNRKTHYVNRRVDLCASLIEDLYRRYPQYRDEAVYFRNGALTQERVAEVLRESPYLGASH